MFGYVSPGIKMLNTSFKFIKEKQITESLNRTNLFMMAMVGVVGSVTIAPYLYSLYNYRKMYFYYIRLSLFRLICLGRYSLRYIGVIKPFVIEKTDAEKFMEKYQLIFAKEYLGNIREIRQNIDSGVYRVGWVATDDDIELWKRRSLMLHTPFGNIYMYYDLFHRGFAYYADNKDITHNILNCVAIRYIIMYNCRDFYNDMVFIEDGSSVLYDIWKKEVKTVLKPFLPRLEATKTPKNVQVDTGVLKDKEKLVVSKPEEKIYEKNHFIYLGKMMDIPCFKTSKRVVKLPSKKMDFSDFKRLMRNASGDSQNSIGEVSHEYKVDYADIFV